MNFFSSGVVGLPDVSGLLWTGLLCASDTGPSCIRGDAPAAAVGLDAAGAAAGWLGGVDEDVGLDGVGATVAGPEGSYGPPAAGA